MKGFWQDKEGKWHKISDMPTKYILNCLKVLKKNMAELADGLGTDAMENPNFLDMAEKVVELNQELLNRYGKTASKKAELGIPAKEMVKLTEEEDKEFWKIVGG